MLGDVGLWKSNRVAYAKSLRTLRGLDFDLLMNWGASEGAEPATLVEGYLLDTASLPAALDGIETLSFLHAGSPLEATQQTLLALDLAHEASRVSEPSLDLFRLQYG